MAVEIKVPTIDGLTLNTKNKRIKDDIAITIGIPRFKGENSDGATFEIDEFLKGEMTEYTNNRITKTRYGFCNNYTIKKVTMKNLEHIGDRTFSGCAYLEEINMPKVKYIDSYGLHGTKIHYDNPLFNSVEELIGTNQFYSIKTEGAVNMPKLKNIATACFASSGLTSFRADNATGMAGNQAFSSCVNLEKAYFKNIEQVGTQMFNGCSALKVVMFDAITNIRGYAFQGCSNLEAIIIRSPNVATTDTNIFHSTTFNGAFYVQDNLVEQYKSATNFSAWVDKIKSLSEIPDNIKEVINEWITE
jgi:hypothetical protein